MPSEKWGRLWTPRELKAIREWQECGVPGREQGHATAAGFPASANPARCDGLLRVDILFQALDEMAIDTHLKFSRILF